MRTLAILLSALVLIGTFALFGQMLMSNVSDNPSLDFTNAVGVYGMGPDPGANNIPWHTAGENPGQRVWDFSPAANHLQLGSTAGADTNDPTKQSYGYSFTTDDYLLSTSLPGAFSGEDVPFVALLLFNASNAGGGTLLAMGRSSSALGFVTIEPASNKIVVTRRDTSNVTKTMTTTNTVFSAGTWVCVEVQVTATSGLLYVNGVSSAFATSDLNVGTLGTLDRFAIGALARDNVQYFYEGGIATPIVFSGTSTAAAAATRYRVIYNSIGLPRGLNLPAPTAYYRWERRILATALPFVHGPLAFDPLGVRR